MRDANRPRRGKRFKDMDKFEIKAERALLERTRAAAKAAGLSHATWWRAAAERMLALLDAQLGVSVTEGPAKKQD